MQYRDRLPLSLLSPFLFATVHEEERKRLLHACAPPRRRRQQDLEEERRKVLWNKSLYATPFPLSYDCSLPTSNGLRRRDTPFPPLSALERTPLPRPDEEGKFTPPPPSFSAAAPGAIWAGGVGRKGEEGSRRRRRRRPFPRRRTRIQEWSSLFPSLAILVALFLLSAEEKKFLYVLCYGEKSVVVVVERERK